MIKLVILWVLLGMGAPTDSVRTISGVVTDGNSPIEGVHINVLEGPDGTITDIDGKFSIKARKKDVLYFSHLGKTPAKYRVKKKGDTLQVIMRSSTEELSEVIVKKRVRNTQKVLARQYQDNYQIIKGRFGYIDKDRTAYTMRIIKGDDLPKGTINFLDALRILVPQVRVVGRGIGAQAFLRPSSSFRGSRPAIYELDGQVLFEPPVGLTVTEIDRIAVVFSTSYASRYGASASGGVIIINTKGGSL